MNTLETALHYKHDLGLNVIPVKAVWNGEKYEKKPLISWDDYKTKQVTDEEINQWWTKYPDAGIAAVVGSISNNVVVIDCDSQKAVEEMESFLSDSVVIPCAKSISGKRHYYLRSDQPLQKKVRFYGEMDLQAENSLIVMPPTKGRNGDAYEWIVEPHAISDFAYLASALKGASINNIISTLYIGDCKKLTNLTSNDLTISYIPYNILQKGTRDQDLFTVANALIKNKVSKDFARQVIEILAEKCNPPFGKDEANAKIASAIERANRKERNLSDEIREFISLHEGYFDLTNLYTTLQILTSQERNNAGVVINRLCKEGVIRKYGSKRGCYEPVNEIEENIIDLSAVETTCLPIKYPFGIHDLVKTMPKNIVIVAGEPNAGKSALLLNIAAKNMFNRPVYYFSSEMGGAELKERLNNFSEKVPLSAWGERCTFIERASDFDVAIRPDDINIIDFLEIHDEFYKVGGLIKKIFDKLNNGIAIIAIQKNPGQDAGLGGMRSLEKARLYLSMSPGVIKIVKAKNWVSSAVNPNGLMKNYKLARGMIFTESSNWMQGYEG